MTLVKETADLATMSQYNIVIWNTGGNYYNGLSYYDIENIKKYLDNGGRFVISGSLTSFALNYWSHAIYSCPSSGKINVIRLKGDASLLLINKADLQARGEPVLAADHEYIPAGPPAARMGSPQEPQLWDQEKFRLLTTRPKERFWFDPSEGKKGRATVTISLGGIVFGPFDDSIETPLR